MKTAVAGTFNILHKGHRALLDRAIGMPGDLVIGITSDEMASSGRNDVVPFYIRRKAVEDYLRSKDRKAEIFSIDDIYGPDEMIRDVDTLVVSKETEANGLKLVEKRREEGGKPLTLSVVDLVNDKAGSKINARDILDGKYSREGETDVLRVAVGSANPVKVQAVREVMESIYGQVRIFPRDVKSGVPEQPFGDETCQGAKNRAERAIGNCDLSVGIEAGVFELYGELFDVQHCAILDKDGKITVGMGSGFVYPPEIAEKVRGGMTVGSAVDEIYGRDKVGHSEGAIGLLSKGLLDRKDLTKQSVLAAMIPRL